MGDQCKESHDVIPISFCADFNNLGVCQKRDCKQMHVLYDYLNPPRASITNGSASASARKRGNSSSGAFLFDGNRFSIALVRLTLYNVLYY